MVRHSQAYAQGILDVMVSSACESMPIVLPRWVDYPNDGFHGAMHAQLDLRRVHPRRPTMYVFNWTIRPSRYLFVSGGLYIW